MTRGRDRYGSTGQHRATHSPAAPPWYGSASEATAAAVGLLVLAVGMVIVRDGDVPSWERDLFGRINDLPDQVNTLLWPVQQLGALLIAPLVAVVAWLLHRRRLAAAVLVAAVAKLVLERVVKLMVSRSRPGTSIGPEAHLRGDVHAGGESFVSGHALLAATLAGLITPYLAGRWKAVPWALVALVMFGRVYVGAHNPLDVICGAGLGVALAWAVNRFLGPPSRRSTDSSDVAAGGSDAIRPRRAAQ